MSPAAEQTVVAATAAGASGAGSVWAIANDAAAALFGVPISVLLAAAAGAFFARTFTPASSFLATMRGGIGWTLAGAYSIPLIMHLAGLPSSIAASAAFVLSCVGQLLAPKVVPMLIEMSPVWIRSWLDRFFGSKPTG